MHGQERILRERFAQITCATCGASHHPGDMLVLAQRESRWLLLLTCWQCQRRSIFVASFPHPSDSLDALEAPPLTSSTHPCFPAISPHWSPQSAAPHSDDIPGLVRPHPADDVDGAVVTDNDVDGMRHFLEGFNGDFRTLFGPPEGRSQG